MGLGIRALMMDLEMADETTKLTIKTDASAAKGISSREGLGKVRHLEVSQLWLQEKVNNRDIMVERVKGEDNKADALTKYVGGESIQIHMEQVNAKVESGRHELMPKVGV